MAGGEISVNATNDFYAGKVNAMRDEYSWEYKRSGAVALLGSTLAFANAALYMAWNPLRILKYDLKED